MYLKMCCRYALEGNHESLKAFLDETECDDEGVDVFGSSSEMSRASSAAPVASPKPATPNPAATSSLEGRVYF